MMQRGSDMWSGMVLQRWLLMLAVLFSLAACGGAVPSTPTAGGAAAAGNAATLAVSTLSTPVFSNVVQTSRTSATVKVSSNVADQYGAALAGVTVIFKATGVAAASNSTAKAVSGANGIATASMTYDPNNSPTVLATAAAVTSLASVPAPHPVASIQLATSLVTAGVAADGVGSYAVIAQVKDAYGSPVIKEAINFTNTGTGLIVLTPSSLITGAGGTVRLTVTDISSANDTVNISALAGGISTATPLTLSFIGTGTGGAGGGANAGNAIALVASVNNLPADGVTIATITVTVTNSAGAAVANLPLTLSNTGSATLSVARVTTNTKGTASFTVKDSVGEAISISVSDGTSTSVLNQTFIPAVATLTVVSSTTTILADGIATATLTIAAKDAQGRGVTGEMLAISTNSATAFIPNTAVTDVIAGQAKIKISNVIAETVTITVKARNGGGLLGVVKAGAATVIFEKAVGSLALVSDVTSLSADNTTQATLTATVLDSKGAPLQNRTVSFTTTGSASLSVVAVTNASGVVTVTLKDATAEAVNVVANINGFTKSQLISFTAIPKTVQIAQVPVLGNVVADGVQVHTLKVKVLDKGNKVITGQLIDLYVTSSKGGFVSVSPTQATADPITGILSVTVSDLYASSDTVTLWASAGTGAGQVSHSSRLSFVGSAPNQPASMGIRASQFSILTNGVSSTTLTITVQDSKNAAVNGALIDVYTTSGLLSASQIKTGATGTATVKLSAGSNRVNATATVVATAVGTTVTTQMPIQMTGTTLVASGIKSNLDTAGTISDTVTLTLKDGGGQPIFGQTLSVTSNGGGLRFNAVLTDPYTVTTDVKGAATLTVDAYGTTTGTKTLTVSLGANTKAIRNYNVAGAAFGITEPATDPYAMSTVDTYTITVSNVSPATGSVTFSTSLGLLNGATTTVTKNAVAGVASATIHSTVAGIANVQVSVAGASTQATSTRFSISLPASAATQVALQAGANVVAISSGAINNSVQLTARVRDIYGQPVAQSPVIFTIKNPIGGGESISPVLVQTNASGIATSTFTSGSLSSGGQGVDIYATIVKTTGLPAVDPHAITNMVIGGTAGSVVIGRGTKVAVLDPATYQLPMSVVVADSNGNAVSGAQVTLNAWPSHYRFGYWGGTANCQAVVIPTTIGSSIVNEDINKNLILDAGEDKTHTMANYIISSKTGYPVVSTDPYATTILGSTSAANDGVLTPGNSVAGTLPTSVITDANGVATFNLTYLKANAAWVTTAITASTQVLGTESTGVIEFVLPALITDTAICSLQNSPFNNPLWGF